MKLRVKALFLSLLSLGFLPHLSERIFGQTTGTLRGVVTFEANSTPVHAATIRILQLGRTAETDSSGTYEFLNVPPGRYDVLAHVHALTDERRSVEITAGATTTRDFQLRLSPIRENITVTASGEEESTFDSFQAVSVLESLDLAVKSETSLGEVLENQPGVAKRSFGPGTSRPVIRGFDGDRVLILQDGIPTGTLSSQSGDHGETMDPSSLESLEVVKGPATLLYGSNAIGGVVNAVTRHHEMHLHPHSGMRGYFTGIGGSNNSHAGGSAGFEYGMKNWMLWGGGGGQKTGDYDTPAGTIFNSKTRVADGSGGLGWYGDHSFITAGYGYDDGHYGVPFAGYFESGGEENPPIDLALQRHNLRFSGGFHDRGSFFDGLRLTLNYSDYAHQELEGAVVGTSFKNKQLSYRGIVDQRKSGRFTGSFGFSGTHRDYTTAGLEALSPPVNQSGFAVFALEEAAFEYFRLQFGGRLDYSAYTPQGLPDRSFTGFSGAAGIYLPLWKGGAFVTNYTHSYRVPALEELYNNGPHVGNLTFEIGNPELTREMGDGIDFSFRHSSSRVRAELNLFYYNLRDFVYLAPEKDETGAPVIEDGLRVAEYLQDDSRFKGAEATLDLGVHPEIWLNLSTDYVSAEIKQTHTPLPRIPPLRGRIGFDARYKGLSVKPGLILAQDQDRIFTTETRTPGYTVVNLEISYTLSRAHAAHIFSMSAFNLGDRLYFNHLSFIKDLAPEIGRGVRFTYSVRFF